MFKRRKFVLFGKGETLEQQIRDGGGAIISWQERFARETTPHLVVVSDTIDFEYYDQLSAIMVPTVTPSWVTDCLAQSKVLPTRPYSPDPHHFMRSVNISTVGLSEGDVGVFSAGVKAAGGEYSPVLTIYTTHLIATDLKEDMCRQAADSGSIRIVTPEWFDDCMKLGRKVDEGPYYLDSARKDSGNSLYLMGTYEAQDDTITRQAIESSVREGLGSEVFTGKTFFISSDFALSGRMQKHIYYLVEANGGDVTDEFEKANVYLFKWRAGYDYIKACKKPKCTVGNLLWLYWMAIQQKWDLPHKHLLHYPEVEGGLPDMHDKIICITNYLGEARNYLKTLIEAIGARYTGTLCQQSNTHLIAAHSEGPKYKAAQDWGIKIVNHLWLEDSYSKWMLQDENIPRYQYLPKRLDLTTLIGSTPLSTSVLKQFYLKQALVHERHLPSRAARNKANQGVHKSVLKENLYRKIQDKSDHDRAGDGEVDSLPQESRVDETELVSQDGQDGQDGPQDGQGEPQAEPLAEPEPEPETQPERELKPQTTPTPKKHKIPAQPPHPKKSRLSPLRVMLTQVDARVRQLPVSPLNIEFVGRGPFEILVTPEASNSNKFLCAMAVAQDIVSPQWLEECIAQNTLVDPEQYRLEVFAKALETRKELGDAKLLQGLRFRLSSKIVAHRTLLEEVIKIHGGRILVRKGKNVLNIQDDDEEKEDNGVAAGALIDAVREMDIGFRRKALKDTE